MLWLKQNKPEEFSDDVMDQNVLNTGSAVGDLAMGLFGPFVEVPLGDLKDMLRETERLLDVGTPIIAEASFSVDGNFCSVDILKNFGDKRVELYEVKSSTSISDIYLYDVGYLRHGAGLRWFMDIGDNLHPHLSLGLFEDT